MTPANDIASQISLSNIEPLRKVAQRVFWWLPPEEGMRDAVRLAAKVMTLATWDDVQTARAALGEDGFRRALLAPPPGVFDMRSWHYWHR